MKGKNLFVWGIMGVLISGILVASYFMFFPEKQSIKISGSSTVYPIISKVSQSFALERGVDIFVEKTSSGKGIEDLIGGEVDIADSSRPLKQEEIILSGEQNKHLEANVIARDAIVVIVHKDNPLENIGFEEINKIFFEGSNPIRHWSGLGIEDLEEIELYGPDIENSGTAHFFIEKVGKGSEIVKAYNPILPSSNVPNLISTHPKAIGFASFKHARDAPSIKILKIEGIEPTLDSVRNGDYPFSRELFMITERLTKSIVEDFISFILSVDGQIIVEQEGFIAVK